MSESKPPLATSEFPRVWILKESFKSRRFGLGRCVRAEMLPLAPDRLPQCWEPYVHISELERLREAARQAIACANDEMTAFGDEYFSCPITNAVELLRKAIGD